MNLAAARAPFGRRNFLLFLIRFFKEKNLQPHMATPSRVEDWFQLVPHLVWEEGANPAGSPLPWNPGEVISVSNVQLQMLEIKM